MVSPGRHEGNKLDGDFAWTDLSYSQSGNQTTIYWSFGWGFHPPSPTDRDLRNGYYVANGTAEYNESVVHNNSGQYYEHDLGIDSGSLTVTHDSSGYHSGVGFYGWVYPYYNNNFNTRSEFSVTLDIPRIPVVPSKPAKPVYISSSTTTIEYQFFNAPDNGGSGETTFNHQVATDAGFTQNLQNWNDGNSPGQATNLIPGTKHYIRYRSVNGVGAGAWSDALEATTLPAVPPGLTIAASPSGMMATLTFTPPGGVTGVTRYDYEYRLAGTTAVLGSGSTTTTVAEVGGLTPGSTYEWRATAWIQNYQSPVTAWIPLTQPKPNTSPGDYFDGNTPDSGDIDYGWTGTPNGSTSQAVASGADGWAATSPGNDGAPALYRVTAGLFKTYAARVQLGLDMTAAGLRAGTKNADPYRTEVTAGAAYVGSIYVKPSRSQNLQAEITWMDAAGAQISQTRGAPTLVPGGAWLRLAAEATAPAGAHRAIVRVVDVTGTGWVAWKSGESMDLDGAMISLGEQFPYFDGDTLDTSEYVYDWIAAQNASVSTRTVRSSATSTSLLTVPSNRALIDPDCVSVPDPPRPPSIPSDCIEDVGIWRRYLVEVPAVNVSDWLSVVPTLAVTSGAFEARQVRVRYYPNPFNLPTDQVPTTEWCAEQIISYMPASTVLTLDGVTQRAWAEVSGGQAQSADHLLYGTAGQPASWPILSCGIAYLISLEVPIDAPEGNIVPLAYVTVRS